MFFPLSFCSLIRFITTFSKTFSSFLISLPYSSCLFLRRQLSLPLFSHPILPLISFVRLLYSYISFVHIVCSLSFLIVRLLSWHSVAYDPSPRKQDTSAIVRYRAWCQMSVTFTVCQVAGEFWNPCQKSIFSPLTILLHPSPPSSLGLTGGVRLLKSLPLIFLPSSCSLISRPSSRNGRQF